MIRMTINPASQKVIIDLTHHLVDDHKKGLRKALHNIGREVRKETRRLIRTGKRTGKMYGLHQASAPGEPPANRTGKLAKSGYFKVRNWREMEVGERAPYSGYLEYGTARMKGARPHLVVAVKNKERDAINEIELAVSREINN